MLQQHADILRRGRGGDGETQPVGTGFLNQARNARPQLQAAAGNQFDVMTGFCLMQRRNAGVDPGFHQQGWMRALQIMTDAFLAAGDGEQFAIQRNIPTPVQSRFPERVIERDPVAIPFGVGKGAVNVEDQGLKRDCRHRLSACRTGG